MTVVDRLQGSTRSPTDLSSASFLETSRCQTWGHFIDLCGLRCPSPQSSDFSIQDSICIGPSKSPVFSEEAEDKAFTVAATRQDKIKHGMAPRHGQSSSSAGGVMTIYSLIQSVIHAKSLESVRGNRTVAIPRNFYSMPEVR